MPRRRFRATKRSRSRAPSIGSIPDIAAGPGSLARPVRSCVFTQHPCHPKRSTPSSRRGGRSVLPAASSVTLAGKRRACDKMPLTDFCNRPSTRAPWKPPYSLAETPCGALCAGGVTRLTPLLQLRAGSRRSPWGGEPDPSERGAPYRTALPKRRRFRPRIGLAARPLTPPVATRLPPRGLHRTARIASTKPSSKGPASSTQSAFHRQVLLAARFRAAPGNPPPSSRFCHRRRRLPAS
jgi:hypothetical protein